MQTSYLQAIHPCTCIQFRTVGKATLKYIVNADIVTSEGRKADCDD